MAGKDRKVSPRNAENPPCAPRRIFKCYTIFMSFIWRYVEWPPVGRIRRERPVCCSKAPPEFARYVEWYPVRPNRIPFNRAFRPVGLRPLRGRNGTQAVPYNINAHEAFIQVRKNVTGLYPGVPDITPARCATPRLAAKNRSPPVWKAPGIFGEIRKC